MRTSEPNDWISDSSLRQFSAAPPHRRRVRLHPAELRADTDGVLSLVEKECQHAPEWTKLQRDDFRAYLRFLGRNNLSRAAIQLRFSALRSFYKFLIRRGTVEVSPIRNISLPKLEKRLPRFLTVKQMLDLLNAPMQDLATSRKASEQPVAPAPFLRDVAILETIYSCGLRVSELCGLRAEDIHWSEQIVHIRGKGRKERQVPIGEQALAAIQKYWQAMVQPPGRASAVFLANEGKQRAMYPRLLQIRLKRYLEIAGLDPQITPHKLRHSYATHRSMPAPTCGAFRNCSDTPISSRRKFTRM